MKKNIKQTKRSNSPMHPKNYELSQKKKKPSIHSTLGGDNLKESQGLFEKTQRKKNNLSKQSIGKYQNTKYRIVTQPVEHFQKIQHLVNGNIFNNSSFSRMPIDRKKNQGPESNEKKLKIQFKNTTIPNLKSLSKQKSPEYECKYCLINKQNLSKLNYQLQSIKKQIESITNIQSQFRDGKRTLNQIKSILFPKIKINSPSKLSFTPNDNKQDQFEIKKEIFNLKISILQLMNDIQSLSKIDFVRMLQTEVFNYEVYETNDTQKKIQQAKSLLNQIKEQFFGPITDKIYPENSNEHNQLMLRNLKSRLNQSLRENLELKIKKQLFLRASEIKGQQQDYIRKTIKQVLQEK